jgi:hypothetical protein
MKSIERRFKGISSRHPFWSSYTCFAEAILGQNFTRESIQYWFNKLVDKTDYVQGEKKGLLEHLEHLNKPIEEQTK